MKVVIKRSDGQKMFFDDKAGQLLRWRAQILSDFIQEARPTSKYRKEYVIRLKEVLWLISKCEAKP